MPTDANRFFLRLADASRAVSSYESEQGCAYLVGGLDAVKTVLERDSAFDCSYHPFRATHALLSPQGREWLGMDSTTAQSSVLMRQANDFFLSFDGLNSFKQSRVTGNLSSEEFYIELKAMFFSLSSRLLFEFDLGKEAINVARASDAIEDIRSNSDAGQSPKRNKKLRSRAQWANGVFQKLSRNIQTHRNQETANDLTNSIQETLLNAAVPLAYAFIWTLLLLGRNERRQTAVWRSGLRHSASSRLSRRYLFGSDYSAVIKEALRLYPPVWALSRTCTRMQLLAGDTIKRGDRVVISPYALHRMRSQWDRPGRFVPERFKDNSSKGYAFIPFGAGRKTCPAARWNVPILVVAVQSFLEKYLIQTTKLPRALPLVALRPSMEFSVSLRLREKQ